MKKCPECGSTSISRERWHDVMPDAFDIGGDAALGQTGDLICNKCGYASSSNIFEVEDIIDED